MELRHLRYFVAVAEALSFTKAAEKLHTAQPSLSRQIKDLEQELGVQLFARERTGVRPTPAGLIFTMDRQMQEGQWADLGMFLQNIMLLAREKGLPLRLEIITGLPGGPAIASRFTSAACPSALTLGQTWMAGSGPAMTRVNRSADVRRCRPWCCVRRRHRPPTSRCD